MLLAAFLIAFARPCASAAEQKIAAPTAIPALQKKVDFQNDVLPIFKRNCLACHNATDAKGDLVLETPATILKGGENGAVVVPRKSQESSLLKCSAKETKPFMPPKDNKVGAEAMKPDELAVLKAWIDQGATGTVTAKTKPVVWKPLPPGLHPILALAVTGDGQFVACGRANQIFICHVATGRIVARLTDPKLAEKTGRSGYRSSAQRDFVQSLAFSPDGRVLASGEYRMVKLWQREPAARQSAPGIDPVSAIAAGIATFWGSVPRWTLARTIGTGDEKSPLAGRVLALDFSADGKLLATGGGVPSRNGELKIWRTADSTLFREILPSHSDTVFGLGFSPDGKFLASASADKFVKVFDAATGKLIKQLAGHTHYVLGVGWRADGRTLASCGADKAVKLWSFPGGEQLKTVEGFKGEVTSVRFVGLGGEMLATSGDTKVRMLKEDGGALRDFAGGKGYIFSAAITPDGQTILGGGQDSVLRAWNAASGKTLFSLDPPAGGISSKAANPSAPKR